MPTPNPPVARRFYLWCREDGLTVMLGEIGLKGAGGIFTVTEDRATAKLWAKELAAGREPKFEDAPLVDP